MIYISLPITGREKEARERAALMKEKLQALFPGEKIVTPFEIYTEQDKRYSYYMGRDIEVLLECNLMAMAQDWKTSKGCRLEAQAAKIYGIRRVVIKDS